MERRDLEAWTSPDQLHGTLHPSEPPQELWLSRTAVTGFATYPHPPRPPSPAPGEKDRSLECLGERGGREDY